MLVIPAIDIKDGQVVRLYKGDYENKKIYSNYPEDVAKEFERNGVKYLHIVDLDGAKLGKSINYDVIKKIRESVNISIEVGGGIRDKEIVKKYLEDLKIDRIILGTGALNNLDFLKEMLQKYGPEKILVGVDIDNKNVSISGWTKTSKINYLEFIKKLEKIGIKYIVVTDISRDGTLEGPKYEIYKKIKKETNINFIVSGGIKDLEDIKEISRLNYYGCIIGKAYYEGKINIKDIVKV